MEQTYGEPESLAHREVPWRNGRRGGPRFYDAVLAGGPAVSEREALLRTREIRLAEVERLLRERAAELDEFERTLLGTGMLCAGMVAAAGLSLIWTVLTDTPAWAFCGVLIVIETWLIRGWVRRGVPAGAETLRGQR
jgi:hypothetical protein